jgi:serine/threonine protein kinase
MPPPTGLAPRPHSFEEPFIVNPSQTPIRSAFSAAISGASPTPVRRQSLPRNSYSGICGTFLGNRYEVISTLGVGAFAKVVHAFDIESGVDVAIKIIPGKFSPATEIEILNSIENGCKSIVEFRGSFMSGSDSCVVFELLGRPLLSAMRLRRMRSDEIRVIARDMFAALAFLHARNIVHCDIKPENLIYARGSKGRVKLADFGTSCFIGQPIFEYFQSRYYRAPEVILGMKFDGAIDVWSLGCVLAEMALGDPLFQAEDEEELLGRIIEVIGAPPEYMAKKMPEGVNGVAKEKCWQLKRRVEDSLLVDLIMKCLVWEPTERITAAEALDHPFFK